MMTQDQIKQYTQQRVRECTGNQDIARKNWKAGRLTEAEYMERYNVQEARKRTFQSMYAAIVAGYPE